MDLASGAGVPAQQDLVALSLLWTEGAERKPRRRPGRQVEDPPAVPVSRVRDLWDLEAALEALGVAEIAGQAAALRQRAESAMADAKARGIGLIARGDADYPDRLAFIPDPPPVLWTRGTLGSCDLSVAIVGSRTATPHGLEVGVRLGEGLARAGLVVVSGLARGVDAASHRGALRGGGRTVAVLGSGVDVVYPPEHAQLAREIEESGALVSEFAPGVPPRGWHFPRRNRIISGVSLGVVIVEASHRSGSLITARCALEQGRSVMAVPGGVLSGRNRGAHGLLRDGARVVEDATDVIEELKLDWCHAPTDGGPASHPVPGEFVREPVLKVMQPGETYGLEELSEQTGLDPVDLLARLARLEIGGLVQRVDCGQFVKAGGNVLR